MRNNSDTMSLPRIDVKYNQLIFRKEDLNVNDYYVKNFLLRYAESYSDNQIVFKKIPYIEVKKIVKRIKEYCNRNNDLLMETENYRNFMESKDYEIKKRSKLGIDIKNREKYYIKDFEYFKNIVSNELVRVLKEDQMWGAFHITTMKKSANFSVPGTGKTSIVYGAFAYMSSSNISKVNKILMIGPKNSFESWKDEFVENFKNKRKLKCYDIHENNRTKEKIIYDLRFQSSNYNLILVNYASLKGLSDVLNEIIDDKTFLVFDEVHRVKAIDGQRANVALELTKNALYKVVLTGTPIPNGYIDIYNILNILYPDEYKDFFGYDLPVLENPNEKEALEINDKIFPFYCRTTKEDLNIPKPDNDIIIECEMNQMEVELFKNIYINFSYNILELYIRLIQASTNPSLVIDKLVERDYQTLNLGPFSSDRKVKKSNIAKLINIADEIGRSTKYLKGINLVRKLVEENKTVLVWGIFIKTLFSIKKDLRKYGINAEVVSGSVGLEQRKVIINKFKTGKLDVLITNPHTLAESVSLHKTCHDAIYFEYSFNLTHMLQSRDRINRLGLAKNQYTRYYYLMSESSHYRYNSIDKKIYKRLKEKEKLMIDAVEKNHIKRLKFDDIEDIKKIINVELNKL